MGRLLVLGTPEVSVSGSSRAILGARRQGLLGLLVSRRGHDVAVEVLVDRLWSDLDPQRARRALRSEAHRLREALWGCATIETRPGGYRLLIAAADLDIEQFEQSCVQGWAALGEDPADALRLADTALGLWRGRPFGEAVDVPDLSVEQARLEEIHVGMVQLRAEARLNVQGPTEDLVAELTALVAMWPTRERLWALLMIALWRCGRQAEALAAYQRARRWLQDELGLEPSRELRELELDILQGTPSVPEAACLSTVPKGIVRVSTGFVGRVVVLDELADAATRLRLITLVGPGGIGKTRLASEFVARNQHRFKEGSAFVDLASVTSSGNVGSAAAAALGITPQPGRPLSEAIGEALSDRALLLLLDNCEHVIDQAAALAQAILSSTSAVTVVATSREPLGLHNEQVWPVAALDPRTEGVTLFCARARAADAGFRPGPADLDAIGDLCVRLDGLPLAIELAASRVRAFGAIALAGQLVGPALLDLAAGRGRADRHHTLRQTMAWSFDLLDPPEQRLFCALSTFVGTCDLEAIRKIGAPDQPAVTVLALVASLVEKSLLSRIDTPTGVRYAMLETLRQFGLDRLGHGDDARQLRRGHALHYGTVVEAQAARGATAAEPAAWRALEADWSNIRLAFQTAVAEQDPALVGRLCRSLAWYSLFSGNGEVGPWAAQAVAAGFLTDQAAEAEARGVWAIHAYWIIADLTETIRALGTWPLHNGTVSAPSHQLAAFMWAQAVADRSLADRVSATWAHQAGAEEDGDPAARVLAPAVRAYYGLWLGDPMVDPASWCDEALVRAERLGAPSLLTYVLVCRAQIEGDADPLAAIMLADRAVTVAGELGATGWIAIAPLAYRMAAHVRAGHQRLALEDTIETLTRSRQQRFRQGARFGLWSAAVCLHRAGRAEAALAVARGAGAHVGRSSLGLDRELDGLFGERWRISRQDAGPEHPDELLDTVDETLALLKHL